MKFEHVKYSETNLYFKSGECGNKLTDLTNTIDSFGQGSGQHKNTHTWGGGFRPWN